MPVTIKPASHGANEIKPANMVAAASPKELLPETDNLKNDNIIQTSFQNITTESNICATSHGFVDGAVTAYNQHHHLQIRPEDIWFSILAQLNIYINEHSEELRHMFVDHKGQKHLKIFDLSDIKGDALWGVDWGKFSFKMTKMIADNIKDPSLRQWILPQFTTTTKNDQAIASIMMMSTLQKYFTYGCGTICGLPSVTLLGEKKDWENLAVKAERLTTFGEEVVQWYSLLKPILTRFVSSFEAPDSQETRDFWQKIVHYYDGGSGPAYLSGWITAFCFWGGEGQCFYKPGSNPEPENEMKGMIRPTPVLQLDEARYHQIKTSDVPRGWASVPVELDDDEHIIPCTIVAGLVGTCATSSGKELHARPGETGLDTLSVVSGWWMYERKTDEEVLAEREVSEKKQAEYWANWDKKFAKKYGSAS